MHPDTPLSFDGGRGKQQGTASADQYARYREALTVGEYCRLNPDPLFQSRDFINDFGKNLLHMPFSAASLSLSLADRAAVHSVSCAGTPEALLTQARICSLMVDAAIDVVEHSVHGPVCGHVAPRTYDPNSLADDALHDRATSLASHSPSMSAALRFGALDGGTDSPPQVGRRAVDELSSLGLGALRATWFDDQVGSSITIDRDLTPVGPDPDELIAVALAASESLQAFPAGCRFVPARDQGYAGNSFKVHGVGTTEYRSVSALQKLPDWEEWRQAVLPELQHAIEIKKGLTLRSHRDFLTARRSSLPGYS